MGSIKVGAPRFARLGWVLGGEFAVFYLFGGLWPRVMAVVRGRGLWPRGTRTRIPHPYSQPSTLTRNPQPSHSPSPLTITVAVFINELADCMFVVPTTTTNGVFFKAFSVALEVFQLGALVPAAIFSHGDCLVHTDPRFVVGEYTPTTCYYFLVLPITPSVSWSWLDALNTPSSELPLSPAVSHCLPMSATCLSLLLNPHP